MDISANNLSTEKEKDMIALIIYLSGVIATAIFCYFRLEKGYKIIVFDLLFWFLVSLCSWVAFITTLLFVYGDKVVFTKK